MPRDDDQSLGKDPTLQGGKETPADERSEGDRSTFVGSEGSSQSGLPDHDMEIVDLSSRYKIEKSLGKGGMGEVLLATDTRLDRKVAIKRIRGDAGSSKAAVTRFLTEAKSIAALNHHNIVQIHDYGRDEQGPFLIMEYVAGGSLLDRCKQGPIKLEEAIDLVCQLCNGLGQAHGAGIIHRDIKPANILLTDDVVPKLTDFGLAKNVTAGTEMTQGDAVLGTLNYMSPEQRVDSSNLDQRSDLWSLGATFYYMLTGSAPILIDLEKVPPQLALVIRRVLHEQPDSRYQNADQFKAALLKDRYKCEFLDCSKTVGLSIRFVCDTCSKTMCSSHQDVELGGRCMICAEQSRANDFDATAERLLPGQHSERWKNWRAIVPAHSAFRFRIWTNRGQQSTTRDILTVPQSSKDCFHVGEQFTLKVQAELNCFLTLLDFGTSGNCYQLLADYPVRQGSVISIDSPDGKDAWMVGLPEGIERVLAIATTQPLALFSDVNVPGLLGSIHDEFALIQRFERTWAGLQSVVPIQWTTASCEFTVELKANA